jgi:pimeloyl-ACP methyl ester carboxylesterase
MIKHFVLCGLALLCLSSCTVLQWRSSDEEITTAFAKAKIPTNISYIAIDSLDLNVRVQSIPLQDATINLLFLHGSPSSLSAWNGYLKDSTLYSQVAMHAVDRPGYGYSNFGDELVSIDTQGKVISHIINEQGLKNVITIGSSYGGPLAARVAIENENVKGVIMISPAIDPENEQRIWQSSFTQFWLTRWLVPTGYRVAGDEKTTHAQELASIENDWSKVSVPVMHIHGDKDELVPYINVDYSQKVFSDIEIITTPETGHEIAWARPHLIKPYIFEMIRKIKKSN